MKKLVFHNVAELLSVAEVVGIVDHSAERRLQTNFVRFRPHWQNELKLNRRMRS